MASEYEFRLPDIGEGVTEGEIVEWFVSPGDAVSEDDPMVEVMTDKATVTIGAPVDGTIGELRFEVGSKANVGDVILTIVTSATQRPKRSSGPPATAVGEIQSVLPGTRFFQGAQATNGNGNGGARASVRPASAAQKRHVQTTAGTSVTTSIDYFEAKPLATPATRRYAKEMGVDLRRIRPSGEGGRVTKGDIDEAAAYVSPLDAPAHPIDGSETREPFMGMRRVIAERLQHAKNTAAHFTFVEECDAGRLMQLRELLRPEAERQGVSLTYLPFIVKAVAKALQAHPTLNCVLDEETDELVYKQYYNIGIATATSAGLMVPVVKGADQLRLLELAREIDRLAEGARQGSLRPDELRDSTFTVTSLGKHGGLLATPILNFPEVGILGVHRIKERPVVRAGEIEVGHIMLLSLSFDHRIVDGHVGAAFAYDVIAYLENPERLLSEFG